MWDFAFEHPVQHWQLECQKELCFSVNHFWDILNRFRSCQCLFYIWGVAELGCFVCPTPELQGLSSSLPRYFLPKTAGRTILPSCSVCLDCPKAQAHRSPGSTSSWLLQNINPILGWNQNTHLLKFPFPSPCSRKQENVIGGTLGWKINSWKNLKQKRKHMNKQAGPGHSKYKEESRHIGIGLKKPQLVWN